MWVIIGAVFLIAGIPIIINECYKANCGYLTVWDGADMLGYYGTVLGSIIAVATLAITIVFTKKQIQRDSFLKNENEKWDRLKAIFMQTLSDINPLRVLKDKCLPWLRSRCDQAIPESASWEHRLPEVTRHSYVSSRDA